MAAALEKIEAVDTRNYSLMNSCTDHVRNIRHAINTAKDGFIRIGKELTEAKNDRSYTAMGYSSLEEFAKDLFGFEKSSMYNYMLVWEKYGVKDSWCARTIDAAEGYSFQQLVEIASAESDLSKFNPSMKVSEIKMKKAMEKMDEEKQVAIDFFTNEIYEFVKKVFLEACWKKQINVGKMVAQDDTYSFRLGIKGCQRDVYVDVELRFLSEIYIKIYCSYAIENLMTEHCSKMKSYEKMEDLNNKKIPLSAGEFNTEFSHLVPCLFKLIEVLEKEHEQVKEDKTKEASERSNMKLKNDEARKSFIRDLANWTLVCACEEEDFRIYKFNELGGRFYCILPFATEDFVCYMERKSYYKKELMNLAQAHPADIVELIRCLREERF